MNSRIGLLGALTIIFVFIAQAVFYIPEAIIERHNWLEDRASHAAHFALVLNKASPVEEDSEVSQLFKSRTDIDAISIKQDGMSKLLYRFNNSSTEFEVIDLHNEVGFREILEILNSDDNTSYRVSAKLPFWHSKTLEFIIQKQALRNVLVSHLKNFFLTAIVVALLSSFLLMLFLKVFNRLVSKSTDQTVQGPNLNQ